MKDKKTNVWQVVSAILAAIASVISSLRKYHDAAHSATSDEAYSDEDTSDL